MLAEMLYSDYREDKSAAVTVILLSLRFVCIDQEINSVYDVNNRSAKSEALMLKFAFHILNWVDI